MRRRHANLLLLLAGAIWGMGFVAQSSAMDAVGPWTYNAAKFLLAALCILPFIMRERQRAARPLSRRDAAGFCLTGLVLATGAIFQQIGILTTSVTNSGFLTGLYVVFTPILGLVLLRARPHWAVWPSALLAFAGIVLIGGGRVGALTRGDMLTVLCAVCYALQIMLVGRLASRTGRPLALSFVQFAVAAVVSGAGALSLETIRLDGLAAVWPEIAYGGVFSTGVAFTLQTIGQRDTTAPQAAIFLSSEALFAALFGMLILGERLAPSGVLGCALIFSAMLAVELVPVYAARASAAS